jgi:hypothetical protein
MKREFNEIRNRNRNEIEKKKIQLKTNNANKITTLERQKMELEDTVTKFQRNLKEKQKKLNKEKD